MDMASLLNGAEAPASSDETNRPEIRSDAGSAEAGRAWSVSPVSGAGAPAGGKSLLGRFGSADPQTRKSLFRR